MIDEVGRIDAELSSEGLTVVRAFVLNELVVCSIVGRGLEEPVSADDELRGNVRDIGGVGSTGVKRESDEETKLDDTSEIEAVVLGIIGSEGVT